jgi:hypothetical protein
MSTRLLFALLLSLGALAPLTRADEFEEERAQYVKAYAGQVSIYLSIAEVQNHKPSIATAQFKDVVSIGKTRYLVFTDDEGTWYLEPKMIYAVKSHNKPK